MRYTVFPLLRGCGKEEFQRAVNGLYNDMATTCLPKKLNGPQGNVAAKTVDSVRLIEWGLGRLVETTEKYGYSKTDLLSCMTLDVEHFHATTHFKSDVMSMLQYCRSYGNCIKETIKRLSTWSVHYFTHPNSWYPLPDTNIRLEAMPNLWPLSAKELSEDDCQRLIDFCNVYGRAVRQRSGRQETTMAKAGSLPPSCYESALPVQRVAIGLPSEDSRCKRLEIDSNSVPSSREENDLPDLEDDVYDSESDSDINDQETFDDYQPAHSSGSLAKEALFLVGTKSRFGRAIRFNGKFVQ